MINYFLISEFEKDFKKLLKKFRTLEKDFEIMKKSLLEPYFCQGIPFSTKAIIDIEGFCNENYLSKKVRKVACASLKNKGGFSGLRVIFVYEKLEKKITFVEIYFKGEKENEDRTRLQSFIKTLQNSEL